MRVSSRDPTQRLPPLIPPPVNIQVASPVDDEDETGNQRDITDLFQQASNAEDRVISRRSPSASPKHKGHNFTSAKDQNRFTNRMEEYYHMQGSNGNGQHQFHNPLGERQSSPLLGNQRQQGHNPNRPLHLQEEPPHPMHKFDDQFDEFVYKSKHMAHYEPTINAMATGQVPMATIQSGWGGEHTANIPGFSVAMGMEDNNQGKHDTYLMGSNCRL